MNEDVRFRAAVNKDLKALRQMLPELADFEVPERRDPDDLWRGDFELVEQVLDGKAAQSWADVAVGDDDNPLGLILVSFRAELLSGAPSAHLEAIVVAPSARGRGLGRKLLERAEHRARDAGAASLSLHVFANNVRARALYDSHNYDSELIRAIKWLD